MLQITLHCDSAYSWTHPIFIRWLSFRSFPNFQQFLINKEGLFFSISMKWADTEKTSSGPFSGFSLDFFPIPSSHITPCPLYTLLILFILFCFKCQTVSLQCVIFQKHSLNFYPGELCKKCFWKSFFNLLIFDRLLE